MKLFGFDYFSLWDVKSYLHSTLTKKAGFLTLKEVLKPVRISISHEEVKKQDLQIIAKINFAGNLFLRDIDEIETYKGGLFLVPNNTIIFSKINARHGCIHFNNSKPFVVSSEYPVFQIDASKAVGKYLHYALRAKPVKQHLNAKVTGVSKPRLNPDEFLRLPIPIPSLEIQHTLLENYNQNLNQAEANLIEAERLKKEIEGYLLEELGIEKPKELVKLKGIQFVDSKDVERWSLVSIMKKKNISLQRNRKFIAKTLGQLCDSRSGGTPYKGNPDFWNGTIPWVSPKDMKVPCIADAEDKITELAIESSAAPLLETNHLLFVVRSGILRHTVPVAINTVPVAINQDMRALKLKSELVKIEYLFLYLTHFQYDLLEIVKTSTTVESIDSPRLNEIEIPIPPLEIQDQIIDKIQSMKTRIKTLKAEAEKLKTEALAAFEGAIFA